MGQEDWQGQTGDAWAAEWRRTDRSFNLLTEQLLSRTRGMSFARVLDIGCGAGELSLALGRGRPEVRVTGIDISPQLIEVAQERAAHLTNVTFSQGDAARWQCEAGQAPDFLMSRHGVMFFDDPAAAFGNLAEQAAPDAQLMFSCFRDRSENPLFTEVMRLLPGPAEAVDPCAPGPFAFADRARVEDILARGGWRQIDAAAVDFPMIAGAGEDPVADAVAYFSRIGPAARAAAELDLNARARFTDRLHAFVERHNFGGLVAFPAAAWIFTACKD